MKSSLLIICILAFSILISGCLAGDQNVLPSSKYIVIQEEIYEFNGTINGSYPDIPDVVSSIPFYYNKSEHYPSDYPQINESLKALLGIYRIENVSGNITVNLTVKGIYSYPYKLGPENDVYILPVRPYLLESVPVVVGVDRNGTLETAFGNETPTVISGVTFSKQYMTQPIGTDNILPIVSTRNITTSEGDTIQYTSMYNITNVGIFDK
jgi:hypothetical protein